MTKKKIIVLIIVLILANIAVSTFLNDNFINDLEENISDKLDNNIQPSSDGDMFIFEWYRAWGGSGTEYGRDIAIDSSDYIYIAGYGSPLYESNHKVKLVKYNRSGDKIWHKSWGKTAPEYTGGIVIDSSDNIYVTGYRGWSNYNYFLVKFDDSGQELWNRTWGGSAYDQAYDIAIDSKDNIYVVGYTSSFGGNHICIIKYNSSGHELWYRLWGESTSQFAYGVAIDSEDNLYVGGRIRGPSDDDWDICLIKYNSLGEEQWYRIWGSSLEDEAYSVAIDTLDNVYVGGMTGDYPDFDMCLIKYNKQGIKQWENVWGGDQWDECQDVLLDNENNIYLAGRTRSYATGEIDMFMAKCDSNGEVDWYKVWGGSQRDECFAISIDSSKNLYLGGNTESFSSGGGYDLCVVKINHIPEISIFSPNSIDHFGTVAPFYNVSINDGDLESQWYTLNDEDNYYFSEMSGTINQSAWDNCENGTISIKFYACDLGGNINHEEVVIHKGVVDITTIKDAFAIIIGIEDYPGSVYDLNYCYDDANSIRNKLTNDFNFKPPNIIFLTDSQATKTAIIDAFNDLSSIIKKDDIFLFYFSGHGGYNLPSEEFMCPYDSIPSNPTNFFYDTDLAFYLNNLNCTEKYVIVDACNSGGLIPESQDNGRFIMTACQSDESCIETSELQHGVFTYYLLQSVSSASDSNLDGVISLEEMFSYTYSHTVPYAENLGVSQHPDNYDGISGQSIIYPSISSPTFNVIGNLLYFSFD